MSRIIAIANQKGGVAKSVTTIQLAAALTNLGRKVLIIDADPQSSITKSLGYRDTKEFDYSLAEIFTALMNEDDISLSKGIIKHDEGMYILPGTLRLEAVELSLVTAMDRERLLSEYVSKVRDLYDYILIDCRGTLGLLTQNALAAADSVLIPSETDISAADGIQELIKTVFRIKKRINPSLIVEGVLFVNVEARTNYCKEMKELLTTAYSDKIKFFAESIPHAIKIQECAAAGVSIFKHAPNIEAARAYKALAEEVDSNEKRC